MVRRGSGAAVTSEIARAQARGWEVDEPLRRSQGWTQTLIPGYCYMEIKVCNKGFHFR